VKFGLLVPLVLLLLQRSVNPLLYYPPREFGLANVIAIASERTIAVAASGRVFGFGSRVTAKVLL
jgi:hypothetical protein